MSYQHHELYDEPTTRRLAELSAEMIGLLGEDPSREGLLKTPDRVAKAMQFLTKGYSEDADAILRSALFTEDYSEMVIVKDIEFYSQCEHHMLPFFGRAHVAYIPNGTIVGLSKIPAWSTSSRGGSRSRRGSRTKSSTPSSACWSPRAPPSSWRVDTCA